MDLVRISAIVLLGRIVGSLAPAAPGCHVRVPAWRWLMLSEHTEKHMPKTSERPHSYAGMLNEVLCCPFRLS